MACNTASLAFKQGARIAPKAFKPFVTSASNLPLALSQRQFPAATGSVATRPVACPAPVQSSAYSISLGTTCLAGKNPWEEIETLRGDLTYQERTAQEQNSFVTELADIDRTAELLMGFFGGLFGNKSQEPASNATQQGPVTPSQPAFDGKYEYATIGGGCFWCIETCYNQLSGVASAVSGYAAGHVKNPTYEQVCGKRTGHAEVVQVKYDPAVLSYRDILQLFFALHDPTTKDRQGNDVGPQYRSIILYHDEKQKEVAEEVMKQAREEKWFNAPLTTELKPLETFYPAEAYHQRYYERNPGQGYCQFVVAPKVAKFRKQYMQKLKPELQKL